MSNFTLTVKKSHMSAILTACIKIRDNFINRACLIPLIRYPNRVIIQSILLFNRNSLNICMRAPFLLSMRYKPIV